METLGQRRLEMLRGAKMTGIIAHENPSGVIGGQSFAQGCRLPLPLFESRRLRRRSLRSGMSVNRRGKRLLFRRVEARGNGRSATTPDPVNFSMHVVSPCILLQGLRKQGCASGRATEQNVLPQPFCVSRVFVSRRLCSRPLELFTKPGLTQSPVPLNVSRAELPSGSNTWRPAAWPLLDGILHRSQRNLMQNAKSSYHEH